MMVTFVTFSKSGNRKEFPLREGTTVIGRKTDADLRIPLNEISRTHCEISIRGDEAMLRDLDSRNGTFLNGEQVSKAPLKAGDKVKLGPLIFTVQINGDPADIPPQPWGDVAPSDGGGVVAVPEAPTAAVGSPDELDIDKLDELEGIEEVDADDLSDLDLDDLDEIEEGKLEEIDDSDVLEGDD